jgi:LPS sulfotransferase NodH
VASREFIRRSLIISFVPRSGSWYLAGLLASTGVAGTPSEAFFPAFEEEVRQKNGIQTDEEYFEWVRANGCTRNGSFATKLPWAHLQDVLGRTRRMHGEDLDDVAALATEFPNPSFLRLRRRDVVAQAVSWARAQQTNQWQAYVSTTKEPVFDFAMIDTHARFIGREEAAWDEWFAKNGIAAREVYYEDVLADPRREITKIVAWLGHELPEDVEVKPYPGFERQADQLNEEWAQIYRARLLEKQWFPGA